MAVIPKLIKTRGSSSKRVHDSSFPPNPVFLLLLAPFPHYYPVQPFFLCVSCFVALRRFVLCSRMRANEKGDTVGGSRRVKKRNEDSRYHCEYNWGMGGEAEQETERSESAK